MDKNAVTALAGETVLEIGRNGLLNEVTEFGDILHLEMESLKHFPSKTECASLYYQLPRFHDDAELTIFTKKSV